MTGRKPLDCLDGPTPPGHHRSKCQRCINVRLREHRQRNRAAVLARGLIDKAKWRRKRYLGRLIQADVPLPDWRQAEATPVEVWTE